MTSSFSFGFRCRHRRLMVALGAIADKGRRAVPKGPGTCAAVVLGVALALLLSPGSARAQVPPDAGWRTVETEHFRVTFSEGLDSLALVAAARSEQAYAALARAFVTPPRGRTEVVLTDHVDVSNGFARVTPYRQITVYARPPIDGFALSHFDDWLELVITHELTHVFHLEAGGGLASALRRVFGRVPGGWPFFPQYAAPRWVIEGMATWYESSLTESGRVRGTQHDMVLRTAILQGRFEDLGQASGQSPLWPSGSRPYIYGASFFDYLLTQHGERGMVAFVAAVAGQWVPYRLNSAAREAFGLSFSEAWEEWRASLTEEVSAFAREAARTRPLTQPEAVTRGGGQALYPQVAPDGGSLVYARSDGRSDPQLTRASASGGDAQKLVRTNGTAAFSFLPDGGLVFSQFQLEDVYRIRSDLSVLDRDGRERRVTDGARIDHPSATPDGRSAVAIQFGPGTASLVEVNLTDGAIRILARDDPLAVWSFPSVSPDGRWIAASRWRPGAFYDVVILDRLGRVVSEVTRDRAVDVAPTWSPDGRWVLWGSDRGGVANLVAAAVDPATGRADTPRQVTHLLTGAAFPSVDPGGEWIYFSHYGAEGWDVARIPFQPGAWGDLLPESERFTAEDPIRPAPSLGDLEVKPYAPLKTLAPRYWEPEAREALTAAGREIIGLGVGLRTTGEDLVGRHAFDLTAVWATTGGEFDGSFGYRYAGLGNPLLSVSADQFWDASGPLFGERSDGAVDTLWIASRERRASLAATVRFPGFRVAESVTFSGGLVSERLNLLNQRLEPETTFRLQRPDARLLDLRASFTLGTARSHAFSIGLQDGISVLLQGRRRSHLSLPDSLAGIPRQDRGFEELLGRLQGYRSFSGPGFSKHVLAVRVSGGAAKGPAAGASHFRLGGAAGVREPITGLGLFGGNSHFFPLRGYESGDRRGRYAWSASAEYRLPLSLLNQGFGLFPLHLDQMSASLFADGGDAWGTVGDGNERRGALASVGAEILGDVLTFYSTPVTLRAGLALPLTPLDGRGGALVYLRFGRSF